MGFFELLVECSVALGGFAAVHAALRGSTGPRGTFRAWGTVAWAFSALLVALVPVVLETAGDLTPEGWRLAHGIGLFIAFACAAVNLRLDWELAAAGHPAQIPLFLRVAQGFSVLGCLILLGALFGSLVGWPWSASPFSYALAVVALFLSGLTGITASFWLAMRAAIAEEE